MKGSIVNIAFIESLITYLVALTALLPLIVLICTRTYLTRIFTRSNLLSTHSNRIIGLSARSISLFTCSARSTTCRSFYN